MLHVVKTPVARRPLTDPQVCGRGEQHSIEASKRDETTLLHLTSFVCALIAAGRALSW